MSLDRRAFLRIAALTASAACSPNLRIANDKAVSPEGVSALSGHERRALDRLCYGVSIREARRVSSIGLAAWIEEQLADDPVPEFDLRWRMRNLDVLDKDADAIEGAHRKAEVVEQLRAGALLRQIYGRRQIHEMMVEFWNDHFNISVDKDPGWALKVVDDREVIRQHAFGSFHDLLSASAHSPAMLVYLDNQANKKDAPNENYARELLELHTLGIDGGYTQADVVELARCLTGWSVKEHFWRGQFVFDDQMHDSGHKLVLGRRLEPSGKSEVERVLDQLVRDPATARHLSIKICRRFLCDHPEIEAPEWVGRLEQVFQITRGNINAVLRKLFLDGVARDPALLGEKFKRPVDFVVSALRATGADTDAGLPVHKFLARMGQPPFAWPMPDGPPDRAVEWSANLAPRWEFSLRLMAGLIEGSKPQIAGIDNFAGRPAEHMLRSASAYLLGFELKEEVSAELVEVAQAARGLHQEGVARAVFAGLLSAPQFQYR